MVKKEARKDEKDNLSLKTNIAMTRAIADSNAERLSRHKAEFMVEFKNIHEAIHTLARTHSTWVRTQESRFKDNAVINGCIQFFIVFLLLLITWKIVL